MPNLRQIEVFRAVMVTKTISGAAEMLNSSQPGLSRMIKHLEGQLGFSLFERVNGRLIPTSDAKILYEEVDRIYQGIERLDGIIGKLKSDNRSVFRIGASPMLARSWAPRLLAELRAAFPSLLIQFDGLSTFEVFENLMSGQADYAVTVYPVDHPNLQQTMLGSVPLVVILPDGHPLSAREGLALSDLVGEPIIAFGEETAHGKTIAHWCEKEGVELTPSMFIRQAETACGFVANGMGVAIVDRLSAENPGFESLTVRALSNAPELSIFCLRNKQFPRSLVGMAFEKLLEADKGHLARSKVRRSPPVILKEDQ